MLYMVVGGDDQKRGDIRLLTHLIPLAKCFEARRRQLRDAFIEGFEEIDSEFLIGGIQFSIGTWRLLYLLLIISFHLY